MIHIFLPGWLSVIEVRCTIQTLHCRNRNNCFRFVTVCSTGTCCKECNDPALRFAKELTFCELKPKRAMPSQTLPRLKSPKCWFVASQWRFVFIGPGV